MVEPQIAGNGAPGAEQEKPLDEVEKLKGFLKDYGQTIVIGVGIALALVLGWAAYRNHKQSASLRASQMLMSARAPDELQQIINQYPDAPVAPLAQLTLAARYFDAGQYDMARFVYSQFEQKNPEHPLVQVATLGRAQCLEAEGQLDQAVTAFASFAAANTNHFLTALAVLGKARCLMQMGKFDEARVEYEDFIAANPASSWTALAESALLFVDKEQRAVRSGAGEAQLSVPAVQVPPPSAAPIFIEGQVPSVAPVGSSTPTAPSGEDAAR